MITIQISTNIIKASTYTDLLNTFLQSNDTQFIKMQNAAQEILENKFENHLEEDEAKYIWNQILDYYPKVEIKGILYDPLKQWYKVEIYNKDTKELYNAKFIKEGGGKNKKYYISYTFDKPSDVLLGDIDCNGTLSILDVTLGQRHLAGNVVLSETQKQAADINCDGQINVNDMTQIQIVISSGVGL